VLEDAKDRTNPPRGRRSRRRKSAFEQLKALLSRKRLGPGVELTEDHVLSILIARRARESALGVNLFSEPAWDLLLELYAARLGARKMSLADLARAIGAPQSTAARWVAVLGDRGLIISESDPRERSGPSVSLTELGASRIEGLTGHWGTAFLSM
jgi:DNA-binding MarR family transcriptional regulator